MICRNVRSEAPGQRGSDGVHALEVAAAMGGSTRMARHAADMWNDTEQLLGAASDHTAIFKFLEK